MQEMNPNQFVESRSLAIVLAGGDGTRLRSYCKRAIGRDIPKQFAPLLGEKTLVEQTLERISRRFDPNHTLAVVVRQHAEFHAPMRRALGAGNLIVQPENRGTAPAILAGLMRAAEHDPAAAVAIFPSDHYFSDDAAFMSHLECALHAVRVRPDKVVLIGAQPDAPETGYGWIEPGERLPIPSEMTAEIFEVRRFREKPTAAEAAALMRRGFLWNTFVVAGSLPTLALMIAETLPSIWAGFAAMQRAIASGDRPRDWDRSYAQVRAADFSRDVLSVNTNRLAVLRLRGLKWSDLGEPHRVENLMCERRRPAQLARTGGHVRF
jgi:mannose-1-phosphate guanylyltransferase